MSNFFSVFIFICIIIICVLTFLCLLRAVIGPKLADRIMAINMIGTMTIVIIMLLSVLLNESNILDVALIYAVISFVAVIVLAQIYIGIYHRKRIMLKAQSNKCAEKENENARIIEDLDARKGESAK